MPSFGDQTAEALVREGRAEVVKRHLDRIAVRGYAERNSPSNLAITTKPHP